jgi:hypothetical protein
VNSSCFGSRRVGARPASGSARVRPRRHQRPPLRSKTTAGAASPGLAVSSRASLSASSSRMIRRRHGHARDRWVARPSDCWIVWTSSWARSDGPPPSPWVPAVGKHDVRPDGVGQRPDRSGGSVGGGAGVDAHVAEVPSEAHVHERAGWLVQGSSAACTASSTRSSDPVSVRRCGEHVPSGAPLHQRSGARPAGRAQEDGDGRDRPRSRGRVRLASSRSPGVLLPARLRQQHGAHRAGSNPRGWAIQTKDTPAGPGSRPPGRGRGIHGKCDLDARAASAPRAASWRLASFGISPL